MYRIAICDDEPIDSVKLAEALKRAIRKLQSSTIVVDTPSVTLSFKIQDVLYIEVFGKQLLLHMQDGTISQISKSLSAISEILLSEYFIKCHRCYIVALPSILSIRRFEITLKDHTKIPVSKYCYNTVQKQLQQYASQWF